MLNSNMTSSIEQISSTKEAQSRDEAELFNAQIKLLSSHFTKSSEDKQSGTHNLTKSICASSEGQDHALLDDDNFSLINNISISTIRQKTTTQGDSEDYFEVTEFKNEND